MCVCVCVCVHTQASLNDFHISLKTLAPRKKLLNEKGCRFVLNRKMTMCSILLITSKIYQLNYRNQ